MAISAESTVADGEFLNDLESSLPELTSKPVYFAFGDDTAFGPYKVDRGASRRPCVEGFVPESDELEASTNCVRVNDTENEPYWYPLERFMSYWESEMVVGVWKNASVGHWVQDERADVVIAGVLAVDAHELATNSAHVLIISVPTFFIAIVHFHYRYVLPF